MSWGGALRNEWQRKRRLLFSGGPWVSDPASCNLFGGRGGADHYCKGVAHLVTDSTLTSRPVSSLLSRLRPIKVGTVNHPQAAFMSGGRCFEVAATNQIGACHQPTPLSAPRHGLMPQPTKPPPSSCARSQASSGWDVSICSASIRGTILKIYPLCFYLSATDMLVQYLRSI